MAIGIKIQTVQELHECLGRLIEQGHGQLPAVGTDCRAYYPIQVYDVSNTSGYKQALLLRVRPDARFAQNMPLPINLSEVTVQAWNDEADRIAALCGAFA